MIYITGDTHGCIDIHKLTSEQFPEGDSLSRNDYLIICGDFGLPFFASDTYGDDIFIRSKYDRANRDEYRRWIRFLSERPYTVLWVDGNHDNHPFWYQQPVIEWNGGLVNIHPQAENVIHLKRGEYYTIDGHTFWTMGGAESTDKMYRVEGYTWWKEEIPSRQEMLHGLDTLKAHGNKVDYIITHTMPHRWVPFLDPEPTTRYFDMICERIEFKKWYCGHFHKDIENGCLRILYNDIIPIGEEEIIDEE